MEKVANLKFKEIKEVFSHVPVSEKASTMTSIQIVDDIEKDSFYFRALEQENIMLNQNQIDAVRQTDGPLLIIAGAGTGKTTVLISRIGYMLTVKKIPASNILLVTYTKKAANEMKERIGQIPGITPAMKSQLYTGTFHSLFLRILREQGDKRKVLSNERFKQVIIKKILQDMNLKDDYQPETILSMISYWKNQILRPNDIKPESSIEEELKQIYKQYEDWKENNQYIDFDDFMLETYFLLTYEPEVLKYYQEKFKYILVDEFQDTSYIQYELMKLLAAPQNNLCVVGDDAQTIYGFRGAESHFILNFDKVFPHAQQVLLDINYRSTDKIVGLGNEIIRKSKQKIDKQLKAMRTGYQSPKFLRPNTINEEAKIIADTIQTLVQNGEKTYKDFAILYRTYAASRAMYDEFVLRKIPFVTYGNDSLFYNHSFVKPIVDILRLSQNPNLEEAIVSVAPVFFLKKDEVERTLNRIATMEYIEGKQSENKLKEVISILSKHVKSFQRDALQEKLLELEKLKTLAPEKAIKHIRTGRVFSYDKYLDMNKRQSLTFHKEMVMEMLNELENSAKRHKTITDYLQFIEQIYLTHQEMDAVRINEEANVVKCMTIHQSKGLEFDTIFFISFIENVLPHKAALFADYQEDRIARNNQPNKNLSKLEEALEEEKRLAYVAITRAKNQLFISSPKKHHNEKAKVSRFLLEALTSVRDTYGRQTKK